MLISLGKNETTTLIFKPNLNQALLSTDQGLDTSQVRTSDSQRKAANHTSLVLIKAKPTELSVSGLHPTGVSIPLDVPPGSV